MSIKDKLLKKLIKEVDAGVVATDDSMEAERLAKRGINVRLTKEQEQEQEPPKIKWSPEQTKMIARDVATALYTALESDGVEITRGRLFNIDPGAFSIMFMYAGDQKREFNFFIQGREIIYRGDTEKTKVGEVGLKGGQEPFVNKDILQNEFTKLFSSIMEEVVENFLNRPAVDKFGNQLTVGDTIVIENKYFVIGHNKGIYLSEIKQDDTITRRIENIPTDKLIKLLRQSKKVL